KRQTTPHRLLRTQNSSKKPLRRDPSPWTFPVPCAEIRFDALGPATISKEPPGNGKEAKSRSGYSRVYRAEGLQRPGYVSLSYGQEQEKHHRPHGNQEVQQIPQKAPGPPRSQVTAAPSRPFHPTTP